MNDGSPKRFMFEHSFDPTAMKAAEEKKAAPQFGEAELAQAREQAYGQGFVAGKEAAIQELQSQHNKLLGNLQLIFENMAEEIWSMHAQRKLAASNIAIAIARKIIPDYVRRSGVQEITAAIEESLVEMINEPRLVLRIGDMHFDAISKDVNAMTARLGYGGKMIILADNTLSEHDCRLEWADGGMERSINFTWSEIERQLSRHQTALTPHPAVPHLPTEEHLAPSSTNIAV